MGRAWLVTVSRACFVSPAGARHCDVHAGEGLKKTQRNVPNALGRRLVESWVQRKLAAIVGLLVVRGAVRYVLAPSRAADGWPVAVPGKVASMMQTSNLFSAGLAVGANTCLSMLISGFCTTSIY